MILNAQTVLETGILWDSFILLCGDRIEKIGKMREAEIPAGAEIIDACGSYVGPGFVDLHVHNAMEKATYTDPVWASEFFLREGTTTMLAAPPYELTFEEYMEAVRTVKAALGKARTLKGLYMEGPYINPQYGAFAHLNPWKGPIEEKHYRALVDEAGTAAKIWTIAAEREGLLPFLRYAREVNPDTVFALGHSEATPDQIRRLGRFRPLLQTHTMCATGTSSAIVETRGVGPDEYCLQEPDVYTELISDSHGLHVHPDLQRFLIHAKGVHRVVLITDRVYTDEPVPEEYKHIGDLYYDDLGGLAGSKLTMAQACRNIMTHTSCGIAQAFIMASLNPAKVLGMDDEIGSVEVGKKADLVFVDDRFGVKKVVLGGELAAEN